MFTRVYDFLEIFSVLLRESLDDKSFKGCNTRHQIRKNLMVKLESEHTKCIGSGDLVYDETVFVSVCARNVGKKPRQLHSVEMLLQ